MYRTLFFLAFIGFAAAFFRPVAPKQVRQVKDVAPATKLPFDDLDNIAVESDSNIHPARKCGFCMGVSCFFFPSIPYVYICESIRTLYRLTCVFGNRFFLFISVSRADELPRQWPLTQRPIDVEQQSRRQRWVD
uniref:Uncharacterized protein n=1 Tax=Ditylum brightwellii TaxID=49249 RepID=A0A7S4RNU9_9STRA